MKTTTMKSEDHPDFGRLVGAPFRVVEGKEFLPGISIVTQLARGIVEVEPEWLASQPPFHSPADHRKDPRVTGD